MPFTQMDSLRNGTQTLTHSHDKPGATLMVRGELGVRGPARKSVTYKNAFRGNPIDSGLRVPTIT